MNLKTGYENLDNIIGGLNGGELITIAGRSSMGKSTLAHNIVNNLSTQTNSKILFFTFDKCKNILKWIMTGKNVEIIEDCSFSIEDMRRICEETSSLSLVIIDCIQLVFGNKYDGRRYEKGYRWIDEICYVYQQLKKMAIKLNIPVIVLSQLSRDLEEREDKRPILTDLKKIVEITQKADIVDTHLSNIKVPNTKEREDKLTDNDGRIMQKMDKVIFLYRENYYNINYDLNDIELIVAKNTGGSTGTVKLLFNKDTLTYKQGSSLKTSYVKGCTAELRVLDIKCKKQILDIIKEEVANYYNIPSEYLKMRIKKLEKNKINVNRVSEAREMAICLSIELTSIDRLFIANSFGIYGVSIGFFIHFFYDFREYFNKHEDLEFAFNKLKTICEKKINDKIEEIKKSIDIVDVIRNYIPLEKRGKNYFGICPFHKDSKPILSVSQKKQIYKCFGCGATGNVITFAKNYERVKTNEKVEKFLGSD